MSTFQYEKAEKFYKTSMDRYLDAGKNYWMNTYNRARALEKMERYEEAAGELFYLWQANGDSYDERVPENSIIKHRLQKLIELHQMDARNFPGIIE